jgi:hypothetical protein
MWAKVCTGARPDSIQSRTRNPMQNSVKNVGGELRNSAEARSRTTYSRKNTEAPIFRQWLDFLENQVIQIFHHKN